MLKCVLAFLLFVSGCSIAPITKSANRTYDPELQASLIVPDRWDVNRHDSNVLYSHQQWSSIDNRAAVGIIFIKVPTTTEMVIWFAQKTFPDGKSVKQWKDKEGREWLEGESDSYHGIAYIDRCWVVYGGYKKRGTVDINAYQNSLDALLSVITGRNKP